MCLQAELRDCQAELSVEQLQLVPGGPKSIDFGEISVGSTSKKSFTVANNLEQSVLVAVKVCTLF